MIIYVNNQLLEALLMLTENNIFIINPRLKMRYKLITVKTF